MQKQQPQETDSHVRGDNRTCNPPKRPDSGPRLRPRGH